MSGWILCSGKTLPGRTSSLTNEMIEKMIVQDLVVFWVDKEMRIDIHRGQTEADLHFTPEGAMEKIPGKDRQFALQFIRGITEFLDIGSSQVPWVEKIILKTNREMALFIRRLFGRHTCFEKQTAVVWEISLDLLSMKQDTDLMDFLHDSAKLEI